MYVPAGWAINDGARRLVEIRWHPTCARHETLLTGSTTAITHRMERDGLATTHCQYLYQGSIAIVQYGTVLAIAPTTR